MEIKLTFAYNLTFITFTKFIEVFSIAVPKIKRLFNFFDYTKRSNHRLL